MSRAHTQNTLKSRSCDLKSPNLSGSQRRLLVSPSRKVSHLHVPFATHHIQNADWEWRLFLIRYMTICHLCNSKRLSMKFSGSLQENSLSAVHNSKKLTSVKYCSFSCMECWSVRGHSPPPWGFCVWTWFKFTTFISFAAYECSGAPFLERPTNFSAGKTSFSSSVSENTRSLHVCA